VTRTPWISPAQEGLLLNAYVLGTLATYVYMSISIINQFCAFLGIHCLRLGPAPRFRAA
jgi:hypothetical protein